MTDLPINRPFGAGRAWTAVVEQRAGLRCECTGQCGAHRTARDGRCPVMHEGWHNKRTAVPTAAPRNPLTSVVAAASLPDSELMAWCAGCLTGATRNAKAAALAP